MFLVTVELSYAGKQAEKHQLDFYDAAVALIGFQRTIAIVTHAVLNDQVITQAPSLRGAQVYIDAPVAGSWNIKSTVFGAAALLGAAGMAPRDSVTGYLIHSMLDYVVSNNLGFHVDYEKTLGIQYEEIKENKIQMPILNKSRADSIVEKCEVALKDIHRPIIKSQTASLANLKCEIDGKSLKIGPVINEKSYEFIMQSKISPDGINFEGKVSSYNMNTFKGRIFIHNEKRPIPFEIEESARNKEVVGAIVSSLAENVAAPKQNRGVIRFSGQPIESRTGRLKGIVLTRILS